MLGTISLCIYIFNALIVSQCLKSMCMYVCMLSLLLSCEKVQTKISVMSIKNLRHLAAKQIFY